jgi:hypothetical protein
MNADIKKYNVAQTATNKAICNQLEKIISLSLKKAESKVWHGHPVWFLEGNPVVGYAVRKDSVQLLFWSGQSFKTPGLETEGSFKAAQMRYKVSGDIKVTVLKKWLAESKKIQWDYKNIVKMKGKLEKKGAW